MYDDAAMRDLRAMFEDIVLPWPLVTTKRMFGSPCYLAAERLFAFQVSDGCVLTRLPETKAAELSGRMQVKPFLSKGKKIGRWVEVSIAGEEELAILVPYIMESYEEALKA